MEMERLITRNSSLALKCLSKIPSKRSSTTSSNFVTATKMGLLTNQSLQLSFEIPYMIPTTDRTSKLLSTRYSLAWTQTAAERSPSLSLRKLARLTIEFDQLCVRTHQCSRRSTSGLRTISHSLSTLGGPFLSAGYRFQLSQMGCITRTMTSYLMR